MARKFIKANQNSDIMSEILTHYIKPEREWKLSVTTKFPLRYVRQHAAQQYEFLFCVEIPWPLLCLWGEILEDTAITAINLHRPSQLNCG